MEPCYDAAAAHGGQAKARAAQILEKNLLLPAKDGVVEVSFSGVGGSGAATEDPNGKIVSERKLDVQVNYSASLNLFGDGSVVPVVGGGGEFSIAFGDGGAVVNYVGTWRPIAGIRRWPPCRTKADRPSSRTGSSTSRA